MEFWLSRSLSHELFLLSRWNSGYHGAFLTNFFFFHDGILAITKPFSRTFSLFKMEFWLSRSLSHERFLFSRWNSGYHELFLFSRWNSGYHEAFLTNFFSFQDGTLAITKPFSRTFSFFTMEFSRYAIWGKTLFIYITKSIYIGSVSLKTLPLDLEPPLQGKEYRPSYSNTTRKRKVDFFSRNYL
jgi:hypothetical protein